jgi:glycerol-3-phosphate dehydrogenase
MQSLTVDLDGPIHYADFGGSGTPVVCVHGLGGSHVNWLATAPLLARSSRVFAPDLAGFGRTPPAGRSSSVEANRALLDRFLGEVVRAPAVLVGNSMGGLISLLQAAERPQTVAGLVLLDPAQPRPPFSGVDLYVAWRLGLAALPGLTGFLLRQKTRLGAETVVRKTFELVCVDPDRIPRHVQEAHVAIAEERLTKMPWSEAAFAEATRSILAVLARPGRFREIVGRVRAPTLLVHGERDRLVPLEASRQLARQRPDWTFLELSDVGHTPQLEDSERLVSHVERWLAHSTTTSSVRSPSLEKA